MEDGGTVRRSRWVRRLAAALAMMPALALAAASPAVAHQGRGQPSEPTVGTRPSPSGAGLLQHARESVGVEF